MTEVFGPGDIEVGPIGGIGWWIELEMGSGV